jgi:hypothetical protein
MILLPKGAGAAPRVARAPVWSMIAPRRRRDLAAESKIFSRLLQTFGFDPWSGCQWAAPERGDTQNQVLRDKPQGSAHANDRQTEEA